MFRPTGSDHAIVNNTFTLAFATPLSGDALKALRANQNPWTSRLPAIREAQSIEFLVRPDGTPQVRNSPSVEFSFLRPDGTPTWVLSVGANALSIECNLYTRWKQVWKQVAGFLDDATLALSAAPPSVESFAIQVVDRFETDKGDESASSVFRKDAPVVPTVKKVKSLWHQHVGWLENDPRGELLQNVNFDVLPRDLSDHSKGKLVNLLHLQRLTFRAPVELAPTGLSATLLDQIATSMHDNNKSLLRSTLSDDLQTAIQLDRKTP